MFTHDPTSATQNQFNLLFRTISDGVILTDRDGLIQRINPAAASMLRTAPESCIGKTSGSVFRDLPALVDLLNGSGKNIRRIVLPAKRIATGISEELGDGNRLVILQDITERESLESRREQLAHAITHDLRNPISAIFGFSELITMYGSLNDDQARFVQRIGQMSQRLQIVTPQLVDLAWLEAGMPMRNVPVIFDQLIHDTVRDLRGDIEKQRSSVAISTQHPMPVVMGDPERLQQVLTHLLLNALHYSEAEQMIGVHAFTQGASLRCTIADRGVGIPPEELDRVFDRMFRGEHPTVRAVPGGGVGLTTARVIVRRHGGTIEAASVVGRGSTFTFTLPLAT